MSASRTLVVFGSIFFGAYAQALIASPGFVLDLRVVGTASGVVTRVHGATGNGSRGTPVAGGYDCDGDQHVDFALASIQASPLNRVGAGEVSLIFGDGTVGGILDTSGFSKRILKIVGAQEFEVAGSEIWIDDVTGDGLGDVLICRQNYTPGLDRAGAGALTILVGGPELRSYAETLEYLDLRTPPPSVKATTLIGDRAYERFGIWVRTGDVTGDSISDIVVGSDEVDSPNELNRGMVYVVRGGTHLNVNQLIDFAQFGATPLQGHVARITPPPGSAHHHFGATVQIADLDGNGHGEVLMASALARSGAGIRLPEAPDGTGQASGGSRRGTLYIAWDDNFPKGMWDSGYEIAMENPPGSVSRVGGASFNVAFGEEILGGMDVDSDGHADLFVGDLVAHTKNGVRSGAGHLFFHAAQLKDLNFDLDAAPAGLMYSVILGPAPFAIGGDTAAQGDFDNDGIADLLFGNPHDNPKGRTNAGSMHILFGQTSRWPSEVSLSATNLPSPSALRIMRIEGALGSQMGDTGDTLCYSAAVGDIEGDGISDMIVNEMVGNGIRKGSEDVGNLLLISGAGIQQIPPVISNVEVSPTGDQHVLACFPSMTAHSYRLQQSDSLNLESWMTIQTGIQTTNRTVSIVLPDASVEGLSFFRIQAE